MKSIGGNSGYIGYSMSVRALTARNEGAYPITDFCKNYGVSKKRVMELVDRGLIDDTEWHHTSKFGNKTKFYRIIGPAGYMALGLIDEARAIFREEQQNAIKYHFERVMRMPIFKTNKHKPIDVYAREKIVDIQAFIDEAGVSVGHNTPARVGFSGGQITITRSKRGNLQIL